jgi:hypothetical protein
MSIYLKNKYIENFIIEYVATGNTITAYYGPGGNIIVPTRINGIVINTIATSVFYYNRTILSVNFGTDCQINQLNLNQFYNCTNLSSIVLPNSITLIGASSFKNCNNLTNIVLPDTLTTIESSLFENCISLTNITLPNSLTTIGNSAFLKCTGLTNITFPNSITKIGMSSFGNCTLLNKITFKGSIPEIIPSSFNNISTNVSIYHYSWSQNDMNNLRAFFSNSILEFVNLDVSTGTTTLPTTTLPTTTLPTTTIPTTTLPTTTLPTTSSLPNYFITLDNKIIRYTGPGGNIIIPTRINGGIINEISYNVFTNNTTILSINFESDSNIQIIRENQFWGCINLTSIVLPNSLTAIDPDLFFGCSKLTDIIFSNSISIIKNHAFDGCSKLDNIVLPNSLSIIEGYVFNGCISLENITWSSNLYSIGNNAFYGCTNLKNIILPNSLTTIGDNIFNMCNKITNITLPNSLTTIGNNAFSNCNLLTNIKFNGSIPTTININSFRPINNNITIYHRSWTQADIYILRTYIDNILEFINMDIIITTQTTTTTIPTTTTTPTTTTPTTTTPTTTTPTTTARTTTTPTTSTIQTTTTLPSVFILNYNIISGYTGLGGNIIIPSIINGVNIKGIGESAFLNKTNIVSIDFDINSEIFIIYDNAFKGCTNLINVILPNEIVSLYSNIFNGCTNLKSVIIPASTITIGSYIFKYCNNLTDITFKGNLPNMQNIDPNAFRNMGPNCNIYHRSWNDDIKNNLRSLSNSILKFINLDPELEVPSPADSLPNPDDSLPNPDDSLTNPANSVSNVPTIPFNNDFILDERNIIEYKGTDEDVIIPSKINGITITTIDNNAFLNSNIVSISFEPNSELEYIMDYSFKDCKKLTTITLPNSLTNIGTLTFSGCTSLTNITLSNNLTKIGAAVFNGCTSLTNITLPNNLSTIGGLSFNGCTNLINIILSNNLTTITNGLFNKCINLKNISLPSSITTINDNAFGYCNNLTNITLPNNITTIGNYIFNRCNKLTNITFEGSIPINISVNAFYRIGSNITIYHHSWNQTDLDNLSKYTDGVFNFIDLDKIATGINRTSSNEVKLDPNVLSSVDNDINIAANKLVQNLYPNTDYKLTQEGSTLYIDIDNNAPSNTTDIVYPLETEQPLNLQAPVTEGFTGITAVVVRFREVDEDAINNLLKLDTSLFTSTNYINYILIGIIILLIIYIFIIKK